LLKELTKSLDVNLAVWSFGSVEIPEFKGYWVSEEAEATLVGLDLFSWIDMINSGRGVYLEALFEIFVLLKEGSIVYHSRRCSNPEPEDPLVNLFCLLKCADTLHEKKLHSFQLF